MFNLEREWSNENQVEVWAPLLKEMDQIENISAQSEVLWEFSVCLLILCDRLVMHSAVFISDYSEELEPCWSGLAAWKWWTTLFLCCVQDVSEKPGPTC